MEIITLEEETLNYLTNDLIGRSITIPKGLFDTLQSCHIVFPDGIIYEAWPTSNIPKTTIFFLDAVDIFRACAVGFRGVGLDDAGTYELMSMVQKSDLSVTLTTQKFNLNVMESDDWHFPGMPIKSAE